MLPIQENLALRTEIIPTQHLGYLEQNQPQIYSLLSDSSSTSSLKKPKRKKTTRLQDSIPVMINPQITRTSTGVTFGAPVHHSTTLPESIPSFITPNLLNGRTPSYRFFIEPESYDANNNINQNQVPSFPIPLTSSSVSVQTSQTPTWSDDIVSMLNSNSLSQMLAESHLLTLNRQLNNKVDENITNTTCSKQSSEYKHLNSSFTMNRQDSRPSHSHVISSSLSSVSARKPKNKQSKRQDSCISIEQSFSTRRTPPCSINLPQSTISNTLPNMIPTSVTATSINSDEPSLSMDMSTTTNFVPLTPPASIHSVKSPSTNMNNEYSFIPIQKNSLPPSNSNTITDVNSTPKQYLSDQGFSHLQNTIPNSHSVNLPYNFHRLLSSANQKYCMIPSDLMPAKILSMAYSTTPSMLIPSDIQKEKKKHEKSIRKSKATQNPIVPLSTEEHVLACEPKIEAISSISTTKDRRHKISKKKDIRTKKQLRHITRRNRLAVLKFMLRKRKQQKQERISIPNIPEVKAEQFVEKLVSPSITNSNKVETHLPDIIAPSLKISFDATQNIESISLYYHRRRIPDNISQTSNYSLTNNDNKLSLLLEAVELIETLQGNSAYALSSDK